MILSGPFSGAIHRPKYVEFVRASGAVADPQVVVEVYRAQSGASSGRVLWRDVLEAPLSGAYGRGYFSRWEPEDVEFDANAALWVRAGISGQVPAQSSWLIEE